jgi:hypothetical protein
MLPDTFSICCLFVFFQYSNDVWRCTATVPSIGTDWVQIAANANFLKRSSHQMIANRNQLIIIGKSKHMYTKILVKTKFTIV